MKSDSVWFPDGSPVGAETRLETHHFELTLSDIETFLIGTRPYHTNIWRNIPLSHPY